MRTTASLGPSVGDAGELASTADSEGTLATAATADAATTLTARDVTAPQAGEIAVSRAGDRFDASLTASDAWSSPTITWTVNGRAVGNGSTVTVSDVAVRAHV